MTSPALAGKTCYFKDVEGSCINKEDVEPIHLMSKSSYSIIREKLRNIGYTPVAVTAPPAGQRCSIGRDECEVFPETISCSGSGLGFCEFLFSKDGSHYAVRTVGEDPVYRGARFVSDQQFATLRP